MHSAVVLAPGCRHSSVAPVVVKAHSEQLGLDHSHTTQVAGLHERQRILQPVLDTLSAHTMQSARPYRTRQAVV